MKKIIIGSAQFGKAYGVSILKKRSLSKDIKKVSEAKFSRLN